MMFRQTGPPRRILAVALPRIRSFMDWSVRNAPSPEALKLRAEGFESPTGLPAHLHRDPAELVGPLDHPGRSLHLEATESATGRKLFTLRATPTGDPRRLLGIGKEDRISENFDGSTLVWEKAASKEAGSYSFAVAELAILGWRLGCKRVAMRIAEHFPTAAVNRLKALGYRFVDAGTVQRDGYRAIELDPQNGKGPITLRLMVLDLDPVTVKKATTEMGRVAREKFLPAGLIPRIV